MTDPPRTKADMLAGAEQRRTEPAREDQPADVLARLPWTPAEADAYMAAVSRHAPIPPGWRLRPGASWTARGGLTTIVAQDPAEEPDSAGRRPSDLLVGMVLNPGLAAEICDAYNARAGLAAEGVA